MCTACIPAWVELLTQPEHGPIGSTVFPSQACTCTLLAINCHLPLQDVLLQLEGIYLRHHVEYNGKGKCLHLAMAHDQQVALSSLYSRDGAHLG